MKDEAKGSRSIRSTSNMAIQNSMNEGGMQGRGFNPSHVKSKDKQIQLLGNQPANLLAQVT